MDILNLRSEIKNKQLSESFYIFTGDEWKVQQIYIEQICKALSLPCVRVDSFLSAYNASKNRSFIRRRTCYVARDDRDLIANEALHEKLADNALDDSVFILILTAVDKRTKFYKRFSDHIIEFERLPQPIIEKHIRKAVPLSTVNVKRLIDVCESDYGRILLELDKILVYAKDSGKSYDEYFEAFLADGTIYTPANDAIFDFVDAIIDRKKSVFRLWNDCKQVGESAFVVLSVLYKNAKAVLQVQSCTSSDVSKVTGLSGWEITNARKHTGSRSNGELVAMLKTIQQIESGIKKGEVQEVIAIDYLLTQVL